MCSPAEYQQALEYMATVAALKKTLRMNMEKISQNPRFLDLPITAKDYDDFIKMQDENVDEMCWQAIREARENIETYERRDTQLAYREWATA